MDGNTGNFTNEFAPQLTDDQVSRVVTIGSPLFEIALVLARLDHIASSIVNANHGIMSG
jgi:hypothetical protein